MNALLLPLRLLMKNPLLSAIAVSMILNGLFWWKKQQAVDALEKQRLEWQRLSLEAEAEALALQATFDREREDLLNDRDRRYQAALEAEIQRTEVASKRVQQLTEKLNDLEGDQTTDQWFDVAVPSRVIGLCLPDCPTESGDQD